VGGRAGHFCCLPIDKKGADLLFQVISQRYERGSIIMSTNKPFAKWPEIFNNDTTLTSAVLDRLLHHAEAVKIEGKSYRMFLGSETGGRTAAILMSLLGTCWANRVNPWAYLKDVLDRMPATPENELEQLLPHNWIEDHPEARLPKQD